MILTRSSSSCGEQVFLASKGIGAVDLAIHLLRVAKDHHGNVRGNLLEFEDQLVATHLRHGMVRQNQVDLVVGEESDGFLAVGGR